MMKYIGVDVGGTSVKAGVVDEAGHILVKGSTPTLAKRSYEWVIKDIL